MQNTYNVSSGAMGALKAMGYLPDDSMQQYVQEWLGWYTATNEFYKGIKTVNNRRIQIHRLTIHPFRRVCREWASLLLNDTTTINAEDEAHDAVLQRWLRSTSFIARGQGLVERAFALGTGAWALSFMLADGEVAAIKPRRYDARMVLPLTWDDDECLECAFACRTVIAGKSYEQLQVHRLDTETATYHVLTKLFNEKDGKEVSAESLGVIPDYDSGSALPTFVLIRPGIVNVYSDGSAMGQSVCADAIGAVQAVDNAFDSITREIDATKIKTFMSDQLFSEITDADNKPVIAPMSPDEYVLRLDSTDPDLIKTYAPDIRIEPLRTSLGVALSELGDLTGFGQQYYALDKAGGLKTATEVSADSSALMRNIRKHENILGDAIERLCRCVLSCLGCDAPVVHVNFDDSIITDTATDKAQMLSEVTAGLASTWEYRARFYGESEQKARERADEARGANDTLSANELM